MHLIHKQKPLPDNPKYSRTHKKLTNWSKEKKIRRVSWTLFVEQLPCKRWDRVKSVKGRKMSQTIDGWPLVNDQSKLSEKKFDWKIKIPIKVIPLYEWKRWIQRRFKEKKIGQKREKIKDNSKEGPRNAAWNKTTVTNGGWSCWIHQLHNTFVPLSADRCMKAEHETGSGSRQEMSSGCKYKHLGVGEPMGRYSFEKRCVNLQRDVNKENWTSQG